MIGVSRDVAARRAINGHARIDLVEIPVAAVLAPRGFFRSDTRTFVFRDFFALLDAAGGEQAEARVGPADAE